MDSDQHNDANWLRNIKGLPAAVKGQVIQQHRKYYELWPGDEERLQSIAARIEELEAENQRLRSACERGLRDVEEYGEISKPPVKGRVQKTARLLRAALHGTTTEDTEEKV